MITTPPNNAMKLTRGGLERGRGVVTASRPGVAGFQDLGRGARPSQLIASVRWATGAPVERCRNGRIDWPKKSWRAQPTTATVQFPTIAFGGVG